MKLTLGLTDFQRIAGCLPDFELIPEKAALLIVDMQYFQVHRNFGYGKRARELGLSHVIDYYFGRLEKQVIPRLQGVISRFRDAGSQIVYCRLLSEKEDGSDYCLRYRSWGLKILKSSRESQILDEIAPQISDIVLNKTTQNVFLSTNLDQILRNLGLEYLVLAGVVTNNCVEAAARSAVDYSYKTFVLEDCCAAFSEVMHLSALKN
ncbi:MAG TPA: isochorismatase family cysteine hydrolase, partial [Candidatus Hodarchaeales archaeon]|nr:isochorismatase family cysteine hydrolase [Candidatus Hodarchaeales archaeon]